MSYVIEYLAEGRFAINFLNSRGRLITCPCCDKPLDTFAKAETLAKNLLLLDAKVTQVEANNPI